MTSGRCRACRGPVAVAHGASEFTDMEICATCFEIALRAGVLEEGQQRWIPLRPVRNRLALFPLDPEADAEELWAVAQPERPQDTSALRWIRSYSRCRTAGEYRDALHRTAALPFREDYTVRVLSPGPGFGAKIGFVAFQDLHSTAEWGIWIGSLYRKTAAYHEAMAISFVELFEMRGLHRVQFRIHVDNKMALDAAENRGGLRADGILRETFLDIDGQYRDEKVFGITRSEWDRLKPVILNAMLYPRLPFPVAQPFSGMHG